MKFEFDTSIFEKERQSALEDARLREMFEAALEQSPEYHARNQELAERTGLPMEVIKGDDGELERRMKIQDAEKILKEVGPGLNHFFTTPGNIGLSYDEMKRLGTIEQNFKAQTRGAENAAWSLLAGIVSTVGEPFVGFGGLSDAAAVGFEQLAEGVEDKEGLLHGYLKSSERGWNWLGGLSRKVGEPYVRLGDYIAPPPDEANPIARGLGSFVPQIAQFMALGPVSAAGLSAGQGAFGAEQRAKNAGASPEDQALATGAGAVVAGVTENVPLKYIMRGLPAGLTRAIPAKVTQAIEDSFIAGVAKAGGSEAAQEAVQTVAGNLIARGLYEPDAPIFADVPESAEVGGAVGALAYTLLNGVAKARKLGREFQAQESNAARSQAEIRAVDEIMQGTADSALKTRAPSVFEKAVAAITDTQDARRTLYIDAREAREYFRSQGLDLMQVAEETEGLDAAEVEAALAGGGDLAIPLSTFAAKFDKHYFSLRVGHDDALRSRVRLREDGLSLEQLEAWSAELPDAVQAALDGLRVEVESVARVAGVREQIYNDAYDKIMAAGVYGPDAAAQMATLETERAMARAERTGRDALELYRAESAEVIGPIAAARALRERTDDLDVLIENARIGPPPLSKTPVLDIIRKAGGVRVGSLLDQELRVMGITPKTRPGLFHKNSGLQDVDNFVAEDYPIFENAPSWNGYVDRQYFIDSIEAEERGQPLRSVDELEQIEHFDDRIEELERLVDYLGLDLDTNSNAEIKAALEELAQQEREAQGRGFYQSDRWDTAPRGVARDRWLKDQKEFARKVDQVMAGKWSNPRRLIKVGHTPLVFQLLGVPNKMLRMRPDKVAKILEKHKGTTLDQIKRAPAMMADPLMIVESDSNENSKALIAFLPETDSNGDPLIAILSPKEESVSYNLFSSVYGKSSNPQEFINEAIREKRVRYYNEGATRRMNRLPWGQYPRGVHSPDRQGREIVTPADLVKTQQENRGFYQDAQPVHSLDGTEIAGIPQEDNLTPDQRKAMRKSVDSWYRDNLQGTEVETEIGKVRFSARGRKKFVSTNPDPITLRMIPAVKAVLEKGRYVGSRELDRTRDDSIVRFHRLEAPVSVGRDVHDVAVLVGEDAEGNLFYNLSRDVKKSSPPVDYKSSLEDSPDTPGSPRSITLSSEGSAKGQKSFEQNEANSDSVVNIEVTTRGTKSTGRKQSPRGRVLFKAGDKPLIQLFEKADLSTYLHESGHVWLEEMIRDAAESPQVAADLAKLMKWFRVSDVKEIGTAQHEQFARGIEAYLREGKAPSLELQGAFGRFKAWLMRLYRSARDLDVELSDEVRGVMERMLATDAQIEEAAQGVENSPVLDMTPEGDASAEGAEVGKIWRDAVQEAKDRLLAQTLKSLSRERTAEWKKQRAAVRAEVAQEVAQRPVYRAFNLLAKGRKPDGTKIDVPIKLWRAQLVAFYGEGILKTLPRPYVYSKTGGLPLDVVAKKVGFGFEPDALIEALQNMEPEQVVVDRETDALMNERHGNPMTDGTLERDALEMVEQNRGAMIEQEVEALAKMTNARSLPAEAVGIYARQKIAQMRLSEATQPYRFYRAEVKAAEQAAKAIAQGDLAGAFRFKQQQLLDHALYRAAKKERAFRDKKLKLFAKIQNLKKTKAIDADYLDKARSLLGLYNMAPRLRADKRLKLELQALQTWIEAKKKDDEASFIIPERILRDDTVQNVRDLSVEDFHGLADAVENIITQGRNKKKLLANRAKANLEDVATEVETAIVDQGFKERAVKANPGRVDKAMTGLRELGASLKKVEFLFESLDGGRMGPLFRHIFAPIAEAEAAKNDLMQKMAMPVLKGLRALPKEVKRTLNKPVPGFEDKGLTRSGAIMVALNAGNASNLDKMMRGEGWTEAQVQSILDQLTAAEMDFVQSVWDALESVYPQVEAMYRQENGVAPERVVPLQVRTAQGVWRGGYFPMSYDAKRSEQGREIAAKSAIEMMSSQIVRAGVFAGMTKARTGFAAPINLDLNSLVGHFDKVAHLVTHYQAIKDANKILAHRKVEQAIVGAVGREYYNSITEWVGEIAADGTAQADFADGFVEQTRTWATAAMLGFNAVTMITQIAGHVSGFVGLSSDDKGRVSLSEGGKQWAKGLATYLYNPRRAQRMVFEKSGEMRHRLQAMDRDIARAIQQYSQQNSKISDVQRWSLEAIGAVQLYTVDLPLWLSAYNQGISQNMTEADAVLFADKMVRTTQSAGGMKDLAGIQRKRGVMTWFTMFYSYFNLLYNMQGKAAKAWANGHHISAMTQLFILFVGNEFIDSLIRGSILNDDEEQWEDFAARLAIAPLSGIPIARDVSRNALLPWGNSVTPVNYLYDAADKILSGNADMEKAMKALVSLFPGGVQANRLISAGEAMADGKDVGPMDFVRGYKD